MAHIVILLALACILGVCVLIHIFWLWLLGHIGPMAANGLNSPEADMSRRAVLYRPDEEPPQSTDCSIWECLELDIP